MKKKLIEGADYVIKEKLGLKFKVFTEKFLLERGYCCENKCEFCPYIKKNIK